MTTFKQKSKVGVAGSFINQMMGNNSSLPEVGKGATVLHYTDRSCYEVIEVSEDKKTVKLESLNARIDPEYKAALKGGDSIGHQSWVLEPTGYFSTVVWKWGGWKFKVKTVAFTKAFQKKYEGVRSYSQQLTEEQRMAVYGDEGRPINVVEGITEIKYEYHPVKIIFGIKDYYYDWSF